MSLKTGSPLGAEEESVSVLQDTPTFRYRPVASRLRLPDGDTQRLYRQRLADRANMKTARESQRR